MYSTYPTPSIFESLSFSSLNKREEVVTLLNHKERWALVFDYERNKLHSRCIIRYIDLERKIIKETRSKTLRFKIKSTFASLPFNDEALTFTGGGFTSSLISKKSNYRLLSAIPDFFRIKTDISFSLDKASPSYNQLYSKKRLFETFHASFSNTISGTISREEKKREMIKEDYTIYYTWKVSSFPLKRDSIIISANGVENNIPFSIFFNPKTNKLTLIREGITIIDDDVKIKQEKTNIYFVSQKTRIEARIFAPIKEKSGPYRLERNINYALFSGTISHFSFSGALGVIELSSKRMKKSISR